MDDARLERIEKRLERIEAGLNGNGQKWFTPKEFGEFVERNEYTVQQWCRQGRIRAEKCGGRAGPYQVWRISREELERYQKEDLLPPDPTRNRIEKVPDTEQEKLKRGNPRKPNKRGGIDVGTAPHRS